MDDSRIFRLDGATEQGQLLHFRQTGSLRGPAEAGMGDACTDPASGRAGSSSELCVADLFGILWLGLADMLGTAAAATLLRRAAQRAVPRCPELAALAITRENLDYVYTLPPHWKYPDADPAALSALAHELWPLLVDLTGSVVVHRLAQIPELRERGILPRDEAAP